MIGFFVALGVTAVGVAALLPLLRRRFLDVPNERSSHRAPVPRGAGSVVMVAILAAALTASSTGSSAPWALLAVAALLASVGFVDDVRPLDGKVRLGLQVVAAVAVTAWTVNELDEFRMPSGVFVVLCLLAVVGYVNAFNFMDGVDGISALNTIVAGGWFALLGEWEGIDDVVVVGLSVAGAGLGFLPWNAPRARVFLGDVGSYGLGLLVVGLAVMVWAAGTEWLLCAAPLTIYGADTLWVLVKRATGGRPLMTAHREHVYQRLVDAGWPHLASAGLNAGCGLLCIGAAWLFRDNALMGMLLVAAVAVVYLAVPSITSRRVGAAA